MIKDFLRTDKLFEVYVYVVLDQVLVHGFVSDALNLCNNYVLFFIIWLLMLYLYYKIIFHKKFILPKRYLKS